MSDSWIRRFHPAVVAVALAVALPGALAQAAEETLYDVFSLSASAQSEIDNDLLIVTLAVEVEDKQSATVADRINTTMSWALGVLEKHPAISARTLDYQTYPTYQRDGQRISGWRGRQSLRLQSDDFTAIGAALETLQGSLLVQGMEPGITPASRRAAENALIGEALTAFRERADLIREQLGAGSYRIIDANINASASTPGYRGEYDLRAESMEYARVAAPAVQPGSSTVQVFVNGRIQLD